jgi:hypothetical protein
MNFDSFVGSAYAAAASYQDDQRSINWYVEYDKNDGAKVPKALLGAPGLQDLGQSAFTGEVRGMYVTSEPNLAIVVVGARVLSMIPLPSAIGQRPSFQYAVLGELDTFKGPVSIRDNASARIVTIVDGVSLYTYNMNTKDFAKSADPAFLGSSLVTEVDGWFTFSKPETQIFYTSPLYWNGISSFDGTYFALKDNAHDDTVAIIELNRQIWLLGTETTEIWYNAGGQYFPWARLQGTLQQIGCAAPFSVVRYSGGLIWLSQSDRGNSDVVMTRGYEYQDITNPAISYILNQYAYVGDAIGYVYDEEGHEFYVLILPTANVTWVFDLTTGEWHQRASFDPVTGQFNRQRANCVMNFQGMIIVGDYENGKIYWQSRSLYTDDTFPLVAVRRAPHLWDTGNRSRMRYSRLQIEFKPGSAAQTGQYTDPQAILSWSDDSGQTFGNDHFSSIGKSGETKNRVMWRRLGIARDRVFQVTVSDPVNRDITGASIMGVPFVW